jgi:hypothetical protein
VTIPQHPCCVHGCVWPFDLLERQEVKLSVSRYEEIQASRAEEVVSSTVVKQHLRSTTVQL